MKRREFIAGLAGAASRVAACGKGATADRMRRIGMLVGLPEGDPEGDKWVQAFLLWDVATRMAAGNELSA